MSEFRRRLMMGVGGGEKTILTDGLLFWFDGKDIDSRLNYWQSSSRITTLISPLKVQYATQNTTAHSGECLERTGANGGASSSVAQNNILSYNPFYTAGMSQSSDVTMEILLKTTDNVEMYLFGGVSNGASGSNSYYRYQLRTTPSGTLWYMYNNGSWKSIFSEGSLQENTVYHLAVCIKEGVLTFYINGVIDSNITDSNLKIPAHQKCGLIGIGRYDSLYTADSLNCEVKIYSLSMYNRILSSDEIVANYRVLKNRYDL